MVELSATEGCSARIETSDEGGTPVLRLSGELDLASVDAIRVILDEEVEVGSLLVVFDMSQLEFMDSSGIALLLMVARRVERVELRQPCSIVRQIVEMMGLTGILQIVG